MQEITSCWQVLRILHMYNWDEPERAPHKCEVRAVGQSVCPYVHDTRVVLIYGYLRLLIATFKAGLMHCFVHQHSTNM